MKSPLEFLVAALLVAGLALGACSGSGGKKRAAPAEGSHPAEVMRSFCAAIAEADARRLANLCTGDLSDFFDAIDRQGAVNARFAAYLGKRFPGEAGGRELAHMTEDWKLPMRYIGDLEVVGKVEEASTPERQTYRIRYADRSGLKREEDAVVVRVDGVWKLQSYGQETPASPQVGYFRSLANKQELLVEDALADLEKLNPHNLTVALKRLSEIVAGRMAQLAKTDDPAGR